ncbi:MAG: (Fe-S)-binding protein [Sulfuricaulis sp.]|uniref:(Fe-S)-binding protein n=1 Tax=Sulfuricaulis sp. TaxID=2003553 RepID=UPI0025FDE547|nr:(Fe-S)-binding protein [Sulfuricaulis sp.]MCR4347512.1 (Fe-S)-binding protein [Sulfuricaulis sp.]
MRVGLFVTCLVDLMRPSIGFAALRLLENAGCEVVVPESQTCCGQPGYNSGDYASAKALALKLLGEFKDCDYVVLPSGSCAGMIKVHYPALLKDDPSVLESVNRLSSRTYELTDFLVNVLKIEKIPGRYSGSLTYHDSCSGLRELGVQAQPRALLAKMPGVTLTEMTECATCCGFGGTFAVKFGAISTRMADKKCANIAQTGASAVVAGDLGCLLNIEGRLRRRGDLQTRVLHIAEVLAGEGKEGSTWK